MVPYGFLRDRGPVQAFTEEQPALRFPRYVRKGPKAKDFDPGQALDDLTKQAVDYIQRRARTKDPFFLYFPLTAPHKPVWPAERFQGKTDLGPYGDFVHQTDWTVGQVLKALDDTRVADHTLVLFTSDNGSYMYRYDEGREDHLIDPSVQGYRRSQHQANAGWRGTKADVWEAGHRVPFLVRWPGKVAPRSRNGQTVCLTDFMATCAGITRFSLPGGAAEDSYSLLALLTGGDWTEPRPPVIHHSANGMFALRTGKWKMVFGDGSGGREKPAGKPFRKPYSLFDLEKDPGETTNLIETHPEVAARLTAQLETLRGS
jgi:arylsulfatase A-like enzyme